MFNLLVSASDEAWNGEPYTLDRGRVFEYTEDAIVARFNELREDQLERLRSLPAIFAFERGNEQDARVGQITEIRIRNRGVVVSYQFDPDVAPIPHQMLFDRKRTLDIDEWELNRTHWAVKDVELAAFLVAEGLAVQAGVDDLGGEALEIDQLPAAEPIPIAPQAFRIPEEPVDPALVAIMMPIQPDFDGVLGAIRAASNELGLRCERADEIWENDEIIQDIFSLIYRARIVVCDFSGQNPNVFYEAGIAHTLGRPVIPIAQSIDDLPFDLRHRRMLNYADDPNGCDQLRTDILRRLQWLVERG